MPMSSPSPMPMPAPGSPHTNPDLDVSGLTAWKPFMASYSVENRPVQALVFEGGFSAQSVETLIISLFHGDEPEALVLAQAFVEAVERGALVPGAPVAIIPALNPDGLQAQTRTNARGVDLNRNYPAQNWQAGPREGEEARYYGGPEPASEPETCFLMAVIDRLAPKRLITLHTPYNVLNYDGPTSAKALAEAMAAVNGMPVEADIGYATPGSFGTYYGKERQLDIVTVELPEGEAFTQDVLEKNLAALRVAIAM